MLLQAKDCYICKKGGHNAKDCPEKQKLGLQISKVCLKCGQSGHDMFSCKIDYSLSDLKVSLSLFVHVANLPFIILDVMLSEFNLSRTLLMYVLCF